MAGAGPLRVGRREVTPGEQHAASPPRPWHCPGWGRALRQQRCPTPAIAIPRKGRARCAGPRRTDKSPTPPRWLPGRGVGYIGKE